MPPDTPVEIRPTLNLPKDLKDRILTDQRLSLHQKFVLFTLYYLDSKGKLDQYSTYVPQFLNLTEPEFNQSIQQLALYNYLSLDQGCISLNVRPLRYTPVPSSL